MWARIRVYTSCSQGSHRRLHLLKAIFPQTLPHTSGEILEAGWYIKENHLCGACRREGNGSTHGKSQRRSTKALHSYLSYGTKTKACWEKVVELLFQCSHWKSIVAVVREVGRKQGLKEQEGRTLPLLKDRKIPTYWESHVALISEKSSLLLIEALHWDCGWTKVFLGIQYLFPISAFF